MWVQGDLVVLVNTGKPRKQPEGPGVITLLFVKSDFLKFINISPFHIGNKVRTNGDKYADLNPGRRCVELTERTRLLLFLLGSLDRFFGGFKFEHDLVVRFSV